MEFSQVQLSFRFGRVLVLLKNISGKEIKKMAAKSKVNEGFYRYIIVILFFLWILIDRIQYMGKIDSNIFNIFFPYIFVLCYSLVKIEKLERDMKNLKDRFIEEDK
jgi:amino acid permease